MSTIPPHLLAPATRPCPVLASAPAVPAPDPSGDAVLVPGPCPSATASVPPRPRILLVTDDPALEASVGALASLFQFEPLPLTGGTAPLRAAGHDLAVVDLRLAPERGLDALEGLRHHATALPLLALVPPLCADTALAAARRGADDFCRATDRLELQLRLQSLLLRHRPLPASPSLRAGDLELDPLSRIVRRAGLRIDLSARQFDLLQVLMRHAGTVLSREQIEAELPARSGDRASNVVEVHVHHLRRRIGAHRLTTLRGQGYLLRTEA